MILYLIIALITLFVGYVGVVTMKYGVLHSISRSFYTLQKVNKGYWFRILMFCSGIFLILIAAYAAVPAAWALYISGIGAILTGAWAMYHDEVTGIIHYIASGLMLVSALLFLGLVFSWIPLIIIAVAFAIIFRFKDTMPNPVFWGEIFAFTSVLISLLWWSLI